LISLLFVTNYISSSQQKTNPPNFIFILADDQGWNGTSVRMNDTITYSASDFYETPNLEKLAKKGMVFSNTYASAPVCAPSRYSIQFGQTPARLQMIRVGMNTEHIDHNNAMTLAKEIKKANPLYKTAHFGKWGMDSDPKTLGYDKSDGPTKNKDGYFNYNSRELQWGNNISEDPKKIFTITESAIDFIEENVQQKTPFYLQLSHYAIHSDLMMRQKSFDKYSKKEKGKIHNNIGLAAMTEDLDHSIGLIMKKLKELGIENNTYIIYSSDNGSVPIIVPRRYYELSYNYPLSRGKWDAMEGGIRVPMIISGPNIKPNAYSTSNISFSDLLPTIIDIISSKKIKDKSLDGGSFKNILFGKSKKIKRPTKGLIFHVPYENGIALKRAHSAIIQDNYKLLKFYDNNEIKLFDLQKDIYEKNDLSNEKYKIALRLESYLMNYLSKVKAPKWRPGITWKQKTLKKINSFH
jgi:arylsulfatase A